MEKPSSSNTTRIHLLTITPRTPPQALHVLLQSPDNPTQGNLITVLTKTFYCTLDAPKGNISCVVCLFSRFLVLSHLLCVAAKAVV